MVLVTPVSLWHFLGRWVEMQDFLRGAQESLTSVYWALILLLQGSDRLSPLSRDTGKCESDCICLTTVPGLKCFRFRGFY